MKCTGILGVVFAWLLCAHLGAAASETPTPSDRTNTSSQGFDPLAPLFDVHQWTAVQSRFVQFGKEHPHALVQLLKSIAPAGTDGTGRRLLYSVNLIVVENGRLLYSFAPLAVPQGAFFYIDDFDPAAGCPLELRDVTGDQVPEIIFHSGWMAVDNYGANIHVLQYINGPPQFRDIRAEHFSESWWWKFRWLDLDGHTLGIVAEPVWPSGGPEVASRASAKFHKYQVYRWDDAEASFVLIETLPSTGTLHRDDEDPLKTDWAYIVAKLKRHRR